MIAESGGVERRHRDTVVATGDEENADTGIGFGRNQESVGAGIPVRSLVRMFRRRQLAPQVSVESLVEPVELTWRFRYAHRLGEAEREAAEIGCGFRRLRNSWEVSAFPYRLILGRPARP